MGHALWRDGDALRQSFANNRTLGDNQTGRYFRQMQQATSEGNIPPWYPTGGWKTSIALWIPMAEDNIEEESSSQ